MNPPALGHPNDQIPLLLFVHVKEGNALGVFTQKHGDHHRPLGCYGQQLDPAVQEHTPLRAIPALSVKITEEIVGSPLAIFVPPAVEALPDSCNTQHFSVSCLT